MSVKYRIKKIIKNYMIIRKVTAGFKDLKSLIFSR